MDWEFFAGTPLQEHQLLHGCFLEAARADRVALGMLGIFSEPATIGQAYQCQLSKACA